MTGTLNPNGTQQSEFSTDSKRWSTRRVSDSVRALLLISGVLILAFGIAIPWLGFYWDDWHVLLLSRLGDTQAYIDAYAGDRPLSYWTYLITAPYLRTNPLGWQLLSLLLRFATVLGMWASLRLVWPRHLRAVTWAAALFAVYPAFTQQPISVAYSQHWMTFALYFFSIWTMLLAYRHRRFAVPLLALSLLATGLHMITMEYFVTLEALRPVFLWLASGNQSKDNAPNRRNRLQSTFKFWLPYAVVLGAYLIWRFPSSGGRSGQAIEFLTSPQNTGLILLRSIVQDLAYTFIATWFNTFQPLSLTFNLDVSMLIWLVTLIAAAGLWLYLTRVLPTRQHPGSTETAWIRQALVVGVLFAVLGPLPAWSVRQQIVVGLYSDRFALAAMPGIALIWVALLEWFVTRDFQRTLIFSLLLALAVGFHLRTANDYRHIWEKQRNFYWQLYWRAPSLAPNTLVLAEGELFSRVGADATSAGLNLLYMSADPTREVSYWFENLQGSFSHNPREWLDGKTLIDNQRIFQFQGQVVNSLVIQYEPEQGECLWVLTPDDTVDITLKPLTREALPLANLERINAGPDTNALPPEQVFGEEPSHTWCYFYQRAELARQAADWSLVLELLAQAQATGLRPNNPREWLPFVEAHAYSGDWLAAQALTTQIVSIQPKLSRRLCALWQSLAENTPDSAARQSAQDAVNDKLGCQP